MRALDTATAYGHRLQATNPGVLRTLESVVPGGVRARASDRLAMAHDASHYLLTPQAVVTPASIDQIADLLRASAEHGIPLTFRSGGTSLSGQAGSNGVLVDTRRRFRRIEVLEGGARVRVQPGATLRHVNARLSAYGSKLGPDPASEVACTIGGVVANNSSGMACGTEFNSYRTLESLVVALPSGTVIDTGEPDADDRLRALEPMLYEGLACLRDRVRSNASSVQAITRLFSLKNTMGYGLNSFLDYTKPVDVLTHLVVGSEGTLAFVGEAVFRTVPVKAHAATGLLLFEDLRSANDALPDLVGAGLATIELLDAASLKVAQSDPKADASLRSIAVSNHAALLVEHRETTVEELDGRVDSTQELLRTLPLAVPAELNRDPRARTRLWHIRKGLYAAVAGARPAGTTALLEDIAVPVVSLTYTCQELLSLFTRHGYQGSVIFGHARDGNIHFLLNECFGGADHVDRYVAFTEEMVELVLGQHGTLKAEHGTGRIMAPFVRRQYGDELYNVMVEVKRLFDPNGVLNPGVLLNDDGRAHVRHLKGTPAVEEEVDRCVECGYCEQVCPSKDLTLTPRQRIVLRREMAAAEDNGDISLLTYLEQDYLYDGLVTCAVDGMCQTACPVLINTGDLVKRLRAEQIGRVEQRVWSSAAKHWDLTTRTASACLRVATAFPEQVATRVSSMARRVFGNDKIPLWDAGLPRGGRRRQPLFRSDAEAVFFPSCTGTMFGPAEGSPGASDAFLSICARANVAVAVPAAIGKLCCATPWRSKGLTEGYVAMKARVLPALWKATLNGRLPVVCDASSCSEGLQQLVRDAGAQFNEIRVFDAIEFVNDRVLADLPVINKLASVTLHPTCSSTRLELDETLALVAAAVSEVVTVPEDWGCCAFAGDRGMLHPELTRSATEAEAVAVRLHDTDFHVSTNRTCEIGMTRATGRTYRHVLELVELATRDGGEIEHR